MQKRMLKRILAGFCTVAMLSQTILETGIAAYAADGTESRIVSEEEAEDEEALSEEAAVSEDASAEAVSEEAVKEAAPEEEEAAEAQSEEAEAPEDEEEEEEAPEAVGNANIVVEGGVVKNATSGYEYGTFSNGVFTVKADLTKIDYNLFDNWNELTEIRFAEGCRVATIGTNAVGSNVERNGAFHDCKNLVKVDMTNAKDLTSIYPYCFQNCTSLVTVIFNDGLNYIQKNSFEGCTSLEEITFNDKLLRIEQEAFKGCKNLQSITLTSKNTECKQSGGGAATGVFNGCAIKEFILSTETENGVEKAIFPANLFNRASFAEDATIVIPDNVLEISDGAFKDSNIAHVKLPKRLQSIGVGAFQNCAALEEIDFKDCDQSKGIVLENNAFLSCISITSLDLQPKSDNGEDIIFKKIGDSAFKGATKLSSLVLPDTVAGEVTVAANGTVTYDGTLGTSVFEGCTSLTSVTVPTGLTYLNNTMFKGCTSLSTVLFKPADASVSTIQVLGNGVFANCGELRSLVFPADLSYIGSECFSKCYRLYDADLSGLLQLKYIGDRGFYACNLFSSVLPESLEHIGANAFNSCNFTGKLRIPSNVNYIGAGAFAEFNRIDTVEIAPQDIASCGEKIFYENYVKQIILPPGVVKIPGNLFNQTTWVTGTPINIPASVEEIGNGAFSGGSGGNVGNIENVRFGDYDPVTGELVTPSRLRVIGENAFKYSITLESIELPESLEVIGASAFANCTKIKAITIPENVTTIGASAFANCSLLEDVTYNAMAVTSSNQNIFQKCNIKTISIGDKVQLFPDYLFKGAQFQKISAESTEYVPVKLSVPASVTRFGKYCLTNVVNLQEISFAPGSNLQSIGDYAFSGCTGLTKIALPASVQAIEQYAFSDTGISGQLDLPANLTKLGRAAFSKCEGITSTVIPAQIVEVPNELFLGCKGLVVVGFAGTAVTKIGDSAFKDCVLLSGIMLPAGIKTLGSSAFQNCSSLERIVIPEGTTNINANCFAGCTGLTEVSIPASVKSIGNNAFILSECGDVTFLVVPDSYADQWLRKNGFTVSTLKKITYELNGGQNDPENPNGYQVGDTTVLKPATRLGCEFGGWYLEPEFRTEITSVEGMTDDFTVYAKWNLIKYTITYVLNEGTNSDGNPENYTVEDTVRFKKAVKTGFSWGGWFTEPEFTNEIKEIKPGTKAENLTLYAKWNEGASSESAFNNTPSINADAAEQDLWLVQGQKFTMESGWTLANPKADKKYVSLSNKGAFKAKKVTVAPVVLVKGDRKINVTITKPEIEKKFTIVHDEENNESRKVQFTYDVDHLNVYWYSAAPDVAVVDQDGTVTAVGKGKAKITAYIYGCAYNCTVTVNELKTENRTLHVNVGGSKSVSLTKSNKPVWSSGDTTVAMMKKSKVTGVAAGHTDLTAVMKDGSIYTVALTVEDITLKNCQPAKGKNKYNMTLKAGESVALAFVSVEQEYVFKSSKPDVAYVDEDGWVVAKAAGKTKLTTKINGKTVTVNVVVTP